jgi:hypothetical protein
MFETFDCGIGLGDEVLIDFEDSEAVEVVALDAYGSKEQKNKDFLRVFH